MKKIMFLCHGNICRSPMAEFIMKNLVKQNGRENEFSICSGAVSNEETGNDVYPQTKALLHAKGVEVGYHAAHKITSNEFDESDLVIVMDRSNIYGLCRIVGEDKVYDSGKVHLMMEYAAEEQTKSRFGYPDVADPWYTRDFERSYQDILAGCQGLLKAL